MKKLLLIALFLLSSIAHSQSLRLIHPNGGERVVAGEAMLLQWETDDSTNLVEIEYSFDNGNNWNFLDTAIGTSYLWKKLPTITTDKCLIKIQTIRSKNIQLVQTLRGHNSWVTGLSYNQNGSKLASSSFDYSSKIWDISNKKIDHDFKGHSAYVECIAYSNDGINVLTGCESGIVRKWNLDSNKVFDYILGHSSGIRSIVFSPNYQSFVTTGKQDNDIKIWNYSTWKIAKTFKGHTSTVWCTAFSPDGKFLVSAGGDNTVKIWNLDSVNAMVTLYGHSSAVSSVCYSNDGNSIISASIDGEIRIWQSSTGNLIRTFNGSNGHVYSLAVSPDNNTIVTGNDEYAINFWDAKTGNLLKTFQGHEYYILKLLFNPTSNTLASSSSDRTIKIWNVDAPEIPTDKSDSAFSIYIDASSVYSTSNTNPLFTVMQQKEKTVIRFDNTSWNNDLSTMKVINAAGVLMEEKSLQITNNTTVEIDTKHYSNGLYFITLTTPTRSETASFMLVK